MNVWDTGKGAEEMAGEIRFDEGFDNILIYDYDREYQKGVSITASTLMESRGRKKKFLDGQWNFCPDVFHSAVRGRWFDEVKENRDGLPIPYDASFEEWDKISVPGVWNNQKKEYALYEGAGLYFREFPYTCTRNSKKFLKIGAANYETRIWLNRHYLGRHLGGFTPFCVDVTEYLQENNRLLLSVDNTRKGGQIPSFHYDWFNYGGIHRSVELIETPETFLRDFAVSLSKEEKNRIDYRITVISGGREKDDMDQRSLEAVLKISGVGLCLEKQVTCRQNLGERTGFSPEAGKPGNKFADACTYEAEGFVTVDESAMRFWNPEDPYLYTVTVSCHGDLLTDEIGFRRIEAKGKELLLNGKNIFLKGMCVHEESPEHLRAVTEEEAMETLRTAKELGCNFLRLTHYPHNECMARLADRLGIMLWEEIPVYWALEFENPAAFADASNQLSELILRDKNRASVIIWSVGNENPDTDARYQFMKGLVGIARGLDKGRLIGASCLVDLEQCRMKDRLIGNLDVVGMNEYYGWYLKDYGILRKILGQYEEEKPLIITETGADAVYGLHGSENEIYTEECQAAIYQKQFEILFSYPFIRGVTPWCLFDYASMRRMSRLQKGYNLKGIIGADRKQKKLAYSVVKEAYGHEV